MHLQSSYSQEVSYKSEETWIQLASTAKVTTGANSERTAICTTTPTSAENWQSERKLGMARRVSQSRSVLRPSCSPRSFQSFKVWCQGVDVSDFTLIPGF